jgi:hypothetical protein
VAKYPAFCGEHNASKGFTAESACKREIAAIMTLMDHVSDGLTLVKDQGRRGPFGLEGDDQYGKFSKNFYEGFDRTDYLISQPDLVSDDGYTAMASALWLYTARQ